MEMLEKLKEMQGALETLSNSDIKEVAQTVMESADGDVAGNAFEMEDDLDIVEISDEFIQLFEESVGDIPDVDVLESGDLDKYKSAMESGEVLNIRFSTVDLYGNLQAFMGSILIKMYNRNTNGARHEITKEDIEDKVFPVVVTSVNEKKRMVTVSHVRAKSPQRMKCIEFIDAQLAKGKSVKVPAVITSVIDRQVKGGRRQVVYIDICGLGIVGYIPIKEWCNTYTTNLERAAQVGTQVTVVVRSKNVYARRGSFMVKVTRKNEELYRNAKKRVMYNCSRRAYQLMTNYDPWDLIKKSLHKNISVRFTVNASNKDKKMFYAEIDGIPNFNAIGCYPDGENYVPEGAVYTGYVSVMNVEKRKLCLRCVKRLESPNDESTSWKELYKGKKPIVKEDENEDK